MGVSLLAQERILVLASDKRFEPDVPLLPSPPGSAPIPLPPMGLDEGTPVGEIPAPVTQALPEGSGRYEGMLFVPGGSFEMGSPDHEGRPDERPRHRVAVKDFYISKHPVTVAEYCRFLNSQGDQTKDQIPRAKLDTANGPVVKEGERFLPRRGWQDRPMVWVSWHGAADYTQWVGGRLPTDAEWEKAALVTGGHAGSETSTGTRGSGPGDGPPPVAGGFTPLVGSVWQWCSDWYAADAYSQSPIENPSGPVTGQEKCIRGGSWVAAEGSLRTQNRHSACPKGYYRTVGFRVVKDAIAQR